MMKSMYKYVKLLDTTKSIQSKSKEDVTPMGTHTQNYCSVNMRGDIVR